MTTTKDTMTTKSLDEILRKKADVTMKTAVARILRYWDRATPVNLTEGAIWYERAREVAIDVAHQGEWDIETAAAVISHLSPRTRWDRNVMGAYALALNGDVSMCLSRNVAGARRAIEAEDPISTINGPKTRRFAANILGDYSVCTIDVWAARAAGVSEQQLARKGVYDAVERAYQTAALKRGVDPAVLQAQVWVVMRNGRAG